MAKITYLDGFWDDFDEKVNYATLEFGRKTARKWVETSQKLIKGISVMPESYPYLRVGRRVYKDYRGVNLMNNFKLIHSYDAVADEALILKIWNMRQSPFRLNAFLRSLN